MLLAILAILFVALNLRIPTTALGPLLPSIQADTNSGETFVSLLTTIPLALTLVIAPFAPRLATRFGIHRVIALALVGIIAGTLIRSIPGTPTLFAGTVLLGCAIALGTVLGPAAIAGERLERRGTLTGVYTMALSLGPAMALGLTVPMMTTTGSDWRQTLALWSLCGVIALVLWIAYTRSANRHSKATAPTSLVPTPSIDSGLKSTLKDLRVWALAAYLGITSLTFYTTSAWLPTLFIIDDLPAGAAGGYASLLNILALPFALLTPTAMRRGWAHILAPASPVVAIAGVSLLLTMGSDGALPVVILLGLSQGLCLGVSYDQVVQYAKSPEHAASVSAVTSTIGLAISSMGPLAFGFGLEVSGAVIPVIGLGVVLALQAIVGWRSGRFIQA
ncbi:MFS transporter [Yaniella flava]|uniref:MFS transporter n=1 Tax=Yaniella flava TaxID=287930 RepID=A0ABP5GH61_9MICC